MDNENPHMGLRIILNIRTPYLRRFLTDIDNDRHGKTKRVRDRMMIEQPM